MLAEYPWRAVRYRYTQRVSINTTGEGTTTTVLDQLTILDPATAEPSPGQLCRSDFMDRRWERL